MTIEELKNKHSIIVDILEDYSEETGSMLGYNVEFILGGNKYFDGWTLEDIDEYCTRVENIIWRK